MSQLTPSSLSSQPEAALTPGLSPYLDSLLPDFRRPVCVAILKVLAGYRQSKSGDGEALKAAAWLEGEVLSALADNSAGSGVVTTVRKSPDK